MGSLPERIFLNMAMTLDGKITDNPTSNLSAQYQKWRKEQGMVPNPIKAVISGRGSVPSMLKMFNSNDSPALVFTTNQIDSDHYNDLHKVAEIHVVGKLEVDFLHIVEILA